MPVSEIIAAILLSVAAILLALALPVISPAEPLLQAIGTGRSAVLPIGVSKGLPLPDSVATVSDPRALRDVGALSEAGSIAAAESRELNRSSIAETRSGPAVTGWHSGAFFRRHTGSLFRLHTRAPSRLDTGALEATRLPLRRSPAARTTRRSPRRSRPPAETRTARRPATGARAPTDAATSPTAKAPSTSSTAKTAAAAGVCQVPGNGHRRNCYRHHAGSQNRLLHGRYPVFRCDADLSG